MRKYLIGTGIIGALTSGYAMLRGSNGQPLTWRVLVAWASWGLTLALAIGEILDIRTASRGRAVAADSPIAGREYRYSGAEKPEEPKKDRAQKKADKAAKKKVKEYHRVLTRQAK